MTLKTLITSKSGMSLLEGLLGISMMTGIIFAFLNGIQQLGNSIKNLQSNNEIADAILRINNSLGGDDRYCSENLKGKLISTTQPNGTAVDRIDYFDLQTIPPVLISKVLVRGLPVETNASVTVKEMRIKPVTQLGTIYGANSAPIGKTLLANLELTFTKGTSLFTQDTVRRIPIYAATNNSDQIVICSTSPSTSILVLSQICELSNYGFAIYDPFSKSCNDSSNVTWVPGTAQSASCPPGSRVAVSSLASADRAADLVCKIENDGLLNLPPRTYTNNFVASNPIGTGTASLDITTSTCTFNYIVGTDLTAVQTKIKCVPN